MGISKTAFLDVIRSSSKEAIRIANTEPRPTRVKLLKIARDFYVKANRLDDACAIANAQDEELSISELESLLAGYSRKGRTPHHYNPELAKRVSKMIAEKLEQLPA